MELRSLTKQDIRGYCKVSGCPWVIRVRTQDCDCVRVHLLLTNFLNYMHFTVACFVEITERCTIVQTQINNEVHKCASRSRVKGRMANIAWVAERAIPLLKRKLGMGAMDVKEAQVQDIDNLSHYLVWKAESC